MTTDIIVTETEPVSISFADLNLHPDVQRAVAESGYERPTPIQAQAIPLLLQGRDLIGGSQTGTGKTAAFALPILSKLASHGKLRCLILEPTRELAHQVYDSFVKYGKHLDLRCALIYGGVKYEKQLKALANEPDVVIATPGRLLDHLQCKTLKLNDLEFLVLDEADRMLDMGFLPDISRIIKQCPKQRQGLLFSATIPPAVDRIANQMLQEPETIKIGGGKAPAETIRHSIYPIDDRQKFDLLVALLEHLDYHSVLIFTRTKVTADSISNWLGQHGHGKDVATLHSNKTQKQRDQALQDFKSGKCQILVATDIVARGIDISDVSHVINYDIPENPEDYVHRIGRTGRASRQGDAVTLYTASNQDALKSIERFIGQEIPRAKLEDFDYTWSPVFDEQSSPKKKKRNRGFHTRHTPKF